MSSNSFRQNQVHQVDQRMSNIPRVLIIVYPIHLRPTIIQPLNSDNPLSLVMNSQMDFDTRLTTYQSITDRFGHSYDSKVWWYHLPLTLHFTYDFWHVSLHNNACVNKHLNYKNLDVDSFPCVSDFVEIV